MRILFLVLLTIVALVGIGLGGAGAWSYTIGPNRDKIAEVTKTAQEAEALGVLMGKTELAKGQDVGSAADIMRQGLRGYRVMQVGGASRASSRRLPGRWTSRCTASTSPSRVRRRPRRCSPGWPTGRPAAGRGRSRGPRWPSSEGAASRRQARAARSS